MKRILKYLIVAIVIIGTIGAVVGYYLFNKQQANLLDYKADFAITVDELCLAFETNETQANTRYLNKIIDVSGTIAEINNNADSSLTVTLREANAMSGVSCNILKPDSSLKNSLVVGNKAIIRGACSGYNLDVALNNCFVVEE